MERTQAGRPKWKEPRPTLVGLSPFSGSLPSRHSWSVKQSRKKTHFFLYEGESVPFYSILYAEEVLEKNLRVACI
jgi:hypothetical protein